MNDHTKGKAHSQLIRDIIERFVPHFIPGADLAYVDGTGKVNGGWSADLLASFEIAIDDLGKMPDAVLYWRAKNWLVLMEAVTDQGAIDEKRRVDLKRIFAGSSATLIFVIAFPNRRVMGKYLADIAWESEVWVADAPTHLIHFNGEKFLGPY